MRRLYRMCGVLAALAWQFCVASAANALEVPTRVFLLVPAASGYSVVDFGALPPGTSQVIRALNNGGEVVGAASLAGSYNRALALNERGDVVGTLGTSPATRAFLWTPSAGMRDLG